MFFLSVGYYNIMDSISANDDMYLKKTTLKLI